MFEGGRDAADRWGTGVTGDRRGGPRDRVAQAELRQGIVPGPAATGSDPSHAASHPARQRQGEEFLGRLRAFLETEVDGAAIEREARIPDEVIKGLAELGAFGMKIAGSTAGSGCPSWTTAGR